MEFPTHIDTISMELSILYFIGSQVITSKNIVFLSLKIDFVLSDSAVWVFTVRKSTHLGFFGLQRVLSEMSSLTLTFSTRIS